MFDIDLEKWKNNWIEELEEWVESEEEDEEEEEEEGKEEEDEEEDRKKKREENRLMPTASLHVQ